MIFLDTSALAKRYLSEPASADVLRLMDADADWSASAMASTEAAIILCRAVLPADLRHRLQRRLELDLDRFLVVPADADCLARAVLIGCEHGVRTLDAIHLAAAARLPGPTTFLSFDSRQSDAARAMGFEVPQI